MSKSARRDYWLVYAVITALLMLAAGFALTWFYLQYRGKLQREISYLTLPQVAISRDGHSMAATIAVKTNAADADWVAGKKQALQQVTRQVLMKADPRRTLAPNGLQALQHALREASNLALETSSVQEILLTDFVVSEGDL